MKRFLFAGLLLTVLTLCSCSRKKTEAAQNAPENTQVTTESSTITQMMAEQMISEPVMQGADIADAVDDIDEEFLAEEERHGTEVLSFLEDEANFTSPIIEETQTPAQTEQGDTVPEVETVEKRLLDAYNRLKVMEYDTELFIPVNNQDTSVLVHYSNKAAVRLFYDQLYRLTKKEHWKMESVENSKLLGTETYNYEGESKDPYEKTIESESAIFVSKLNENGLVIRTEKYAVEAGGKSGAKKSPLEITTWTYDEQKRILSETVTQGKLVKKQVFNYEKVDKGQGDDTEEKNDLPPDYEYYENGVLVTKTEYIQKGVYSTTIWFDSANSVRTDYENYVKVRDVYYTNGVERRVRNYE